LFYLIHNPVCCDLMTFTSLIPIYFKKPMNFLCKNVCLLFNLIQSTHLCKTPVCIQTCVWHSTILVMMKYKLLSFIDGDCIWFWILRLCSQIYRKTESSQSYRYQTRHVHWFGSWNHVVYHLLQLCYCILVWCYTYLGIKRERGFWIHTGNPRHCKWLTFLSVWILLFY